MGRPPWLRRRRKGATTVVGGGRHSDGGQKKFKVHTKSHSLLHGWRRQPGIFGRKSAARSRIPRKLILKVASSQVAGSEASRQSPAAFLLTTHYTLLATPIMTPRKKKLIAGNWKMNKTSADCRCARRVKSSLPPEKINDVDIVVLSAFSWPSNPPARRSKGSTVKTRRGKNMHPEGGAVRTRERFSAGMLRRRLFANARDSWSQRGRRAYFAEDRCVSSI